jgi:1-deoxy-D-xylulose-5-phosphate reductoisomerase
MRAGNGRILDVRALTREAARLGGAAPAVHNEASEACVSDYLKGSISLTRIVDMVARVVSEHDTSGTGATTIGDASRWTPRRGRGPGG